MDYYLLTLSIIPLFVGRAALPIFATACFARWGNGIDVSWLGFFEDFTGIGLLSSIPAWAIGDEVLLILGLFAAIEFLVRHIPETRFLVDGASDTMIKAMAAGCCSYLLVGGGIDGLLDIWVQTGDITNFEWGLGLQYTWSFGVGIAVFVLASARRIFWELLEDVDPDGDLGITSLLLWAEDGIGFVGVFFVFIMPGLTALAAVVGVTAAWILLTSLKAVERAGHAACGSCAVRGPACGPHCGSCGVTRSEVRGVGVLGRVTGQAATPGPQHQVALIAGHRCPHCGQRLGRTSEEPRCAACERPVFGSDSDRATYVESLSSRLPSTLLVCLLCSAVPVVGLIPGFLYYRLTLLAGLRAYMPPQSRFFRRWMLRLLKIGLIMLQWVPLVGALTLPVICMVDFHFARRAVLSQGVPSSP